MDFFYVVASYLLGSLNFPILAGRLKGWDIRERDMAGASGVFRQMGAGWGVLVLGLEVGKGALAAWLGTHGENLWTLPLCALAVVAGHVWPVFFGFRGGGGLAAAVGFALFAFLLPALGMLLVTALMVGVYLLIFKRDRLEGLGALPFGAIFGFVFLIYALRSEPQQLYAVLALASVMALRGVLVLTGRWR